MIKEGHLYILQTPLFRVRNKKQFTVILKRNEEQPSKKLKPKPEITRFKGLGEISPNEFQFY
jgi:topoisomerase-4 subunit B